jgi:hypothetical protein
MRLEWIQASGEVGWRTVRLATGAAIASFATHAFALGLGEPNVASVLGQPLQMTVPLMMDAGTALAQECVRIIPGNQSGEPTPSLNAGRITVDAAGRQLRIESLRPISEPTLRVAVEVGCNEHVRREFALLLDPPSIVAPASSSGLAGQPVASLGLGMAQISAVIGQRLTMKVPVVGADAGALTAACVHLADPVSSEGAPVLRQADIRVLPYEGGSLIEVATPDPVTQSAVRLALDVGCRDPLRREYAVMLGLPALAASNSGIPVAAAEPAPETEPKPAVARATKAPKTAPALPVAPESGRTRAAAQPHEPSAKAPQPVTPGPDRLVLGSPQEIVSLSALGSDAGAALDPSAELARRMDAMSRQIEALQAQLLASRQHEQELERQALETREQWTWSMIALAVVLLLGALVMAWRQRRSVAQVAWEPVVTRPPQVTVPRPVMPRASTDTFARESSEIAGRATMPGRAANTATPTTGITEPSLTDERNSQITVTELHDTVQVIKELYATVLERNTSTSTGGSGGKKPSRPLELDLRTPPRAAPPTVSPPPLAERARSEGSDKRATEERFTQLPTEVGLDLDLGSVVASAPEVVLTDLLAPGSTERASPAEEPVAAAAPAQPPVQAAKLEGPSDDNLTQTPTEVLIDIDVGTTTGFSPATVGAAPRLNSQRPEAERSTRNTPSKLEPIDLQLDLSQSQGRSRQRAGRGA